MWYVIQTETGREEEVLYMMRRLLDKRLCSISISKRNFIIPCILLPVAIISPRTTIGEGVAILPQSTVGEAEIGDICILASNSLVNIDAEIGNFSHIDCGGIVLKNDKVPDGTWVKSGKIYRKKSKEGQEE